MQSTTGIAYALEKESGEPLLFKGGDSAHTDILSYGRLLNRPKADIDLKQKDRLAAVSPKSDQMF
jgi:hypothetical protein